MTSAARSTAALIIVLVGFLLTVSLAAAGELTQQSMSINLHGELAPRALVSLVFLEVVPQGALPGAAIVAGLTASTNSRTGCMISIESVSGPAGAGVVTLTALAGNGMPVQYGVDRTTLPLLRHGGEDSRTQIFEIASPAGGPADAPSTLYLNITAR